MGRRRTAWASAAPLRGPRRLIRKALGKKPAISIAPAGASAASPCWAAGFAMAKGRHARRAFIGTAVRDGLDPRCHQPP
jgi:hypothetical protein